MLLMAICVRYVTVSDAEWLVCSRCFTLLDCDTPRQSPAPHDVGGVKVHPSRLRGVKCGGDAMLHADRNANGHHHQYVAG